MKILARAFIPLAAALVAAPCALAQVTYEEAMAPSPYAVTAAAYSDAELDQMLAPIALYPDELLSQILMAATYPLEIVEAARWSRANPGLQGEDAVGAVDARDWDPSVKSLVAFPQVLQQMDADLDWTQRLGEAFLAQQDGVMASVQRLRRAAMSAGSLSTTDELVVTREGTDIAIDSPSPDTVYVPYYDPGVAYGNWWWPSYPPMAWSPWPGYYYSGGYGLAWTIGVPVGIDFFYGDFDWRRHHVRLHDHRPFYDHDHDRDNRWRHDPHHRRGVQYRNPIARQEFGGATAPRPPRNARNGQRGRVQTPSGGSPIARPDRSGNRVTPPSPPARIVQPGANPLTRPQVQQPLARPQVQQPLARPQVQQPLARPQVQQPLARPQAPAQRVPQRDMGPVHAAPQPAPQVHTPQVQHVPQQPLQRAPQPQVRVAPPQPAPSAPARIAPVAPHPAPAQPAARPSTPPPPPARGSDPPQNPMAR